MTGYGTVGNLFGFNFSQNANIYTLTFAVVVVSLSLSTTQLIVLEAVLDLAIPFLPEA